MKILRKIFPCRNREMYHANYSKPIWEEKRFFVLRCLLSYSQEYNKHTCDNCSLYKLGLPKWVKDFDRAITENPAPCF